MLRSAFVFSVLLGLKVLSRFFYRPVMTFIGDVPPNPWREIRLVAFLNHTSLFEPVFLGGVPNHFLWRLARHGVVPVADKTSGRPLVGLIFKLVANEVVPVTRQRDHTWFEVLRSIDPDSMVVIFPEGRMKRANGLDANGNPMTVRGGIADIIDAVGEGRMLIAYSGGLHHVQIPGSKKAHLFQTVRMNLEVLDIASYEKELKATAPEGDFKRAVKEDLERRRDTNCPEEAKN